MNRSQRFFPLLTLLMLAPTVPAMAGDAPLPPVNDDRAEATVITGLRFTDHLDVAGAGRAADDPELTGPDCWATPERTVWYAFTPPEDVRVAADTFGSDHDTLLAVFAVTADGLAQIDCNDDAAWTSQSRVHLDLDAGTSYLFQVGAHEGQEGSDLRFHLDVDDEPLLGGETTVAPIGILAQRDGRAVLEGTITCSREASVAVDYVVVQGRTHAYGWTDVIECRPGEIVPWSAGYVEGGRLRRGDAQVIANTYYQDGLDYRVTTLETSVTLRRGGGR